MARAMTPELAMALLKDRDSDMSQGDADLVALCIADLCRQVAAAHSTALLAAQAGMSEFITWYSTDVRLPDADLTVNIAVEGDQHEPVWLGFLDGDEWRSVDGAPIVGRVTAWAPMLMGPAAPLVHARSPEVSP